MTTKSSNKRSQSNLWPIVDFHGSYDGLCGYCKKEKGKISIGFRGYNVSCEVYEKLLERNWRRSGSWFYKPENDRTCCKQYAIRTNVNNFAPHKSQRKVLKKMENFLNTGRVSSASSAEKSASSSKAEQQETTRPAEPVSSNEVVNEKKRKRGASSQSANFQEMENKRRVEQVMNQALKQMIEKDGNLQKITSQQKPVTVHLMTPKQQNKQTESTASDHYCTNVAIVLAGLVNKYNKKAETEKAAQKISTAEYSAKLMSQKLVELLQNQFQLEETSLVDSITYAESGYINLTIPIPQPSSPSSPESKKKRCAIEGETLSFDKHEKEESRDEEDEGSNSSSSDDTHEITLKFTKSAFDRLEFNLYKKYQVEIHKDKAEDLTEKRYTNFLVDSPLVYDSSAPEHVKKYFKQGYGSYHIQYLLDGKLIGVSVLDVLPTGLSSVYFFYDTDYSFLSLGVYSAIREIQLSKEIGFPYYYLGYYIHNCKKMKYKGKFTPSDLLCNVTYKWIPLEKAFPKLDAQPYCAFADNVPSTKKASASNNSELLVLFQQTALPLRRLIDTGLVQLNSEAKQRSRLIVESMGPEIVSQVLWYLSDEDLEMPK